MFFVDDYFYSIDDLENQYAIFDRISFLKECENSRLAVCIPDVFQWLTLCLYVRQKGGSIVPIHPSMPKEGAMKMAHATNSHSLLYDTIHSPIEIDSDKKEAEGVLVQMSSGTTGAPKSIERTWESVDEELKSYASILPIQMGTKSIIACPTTHSYGLISGVFSALKRGEAPVIITNMNPRYVLKKLNQFPNHILYAGPALLSPLTSLLSNRQKLDRVMVSGSLMTDQLLTTLKEKSNEVSQQYGCSEAGCITVNTHVNNAREMGCPLPHLTVKAGSENDPNEIILSTSTKTIYTKDIGYMVNGTLTFLGRMDDTINVAGLNVYPQDVENVLLNEPRIIEAVVYKRRHHFSGERVCAQYVSTEPIENNELRQWCHKYLAPYQVPMELERVPKIEKLPNGKISRKLLGGVM
ncbi:AMP-binding protein [Bacillus spongiae]|uniref:AMP-binding protein n=1 Tax=Bacillus spongiae TaxID=2683610 RepID=A0ABU8HA34_9BACI